MGNMAIEPNINVINPDKYWKEIRREFIIIWLVFLSFTVKC